jgi:murein DD-endopeptidase MepM/ murein hydrolase activator NlpD
MVSKKRSDCLVPTQTRRFIIPLVAGTAVLAACSADVSRFNFDDSPTTGALPPTPPESVYSGPSNLGKSTPERSLADVGSGAQQGFNDRGYNPQGAPSNGDVQVKPLEQVQTQPQVAPVVQPANQPTVMNQPVRQPTYAATPRPAPEEAQASSTVIEVERGDTLYGLSRRHRVSVKDLMAVNGLTGTNLRPGQKLALPASRVNRSAPKQVTVAAANAPSHWSDSHTVQPGDSLYVLARRYNVKTRDLQRYNGISNPRLLKPGMVLRVPGPGGQNGTIAARDPAPRAVTTRRVTSQTISTPSSPTVLNGSGPSTPKQVAAVQTETKASDAIPSQSVTVSTEKTGTDSVTKLRWPARGRIISAFGKREDGTHNDGINLAVPLGTTIHAVEGGMVAYAGDELKGYGNLVLIRHDNGWVTAYAHAEKLLVKRGDKVRRGDVIAKAGKTGDVALPQLHFELRQGQTPVDPIPYLERI